MDSKKSYHHELDPRCPILMDSLADIYKKQAERDTGKGVTWWRPALRMTFKEIYLEALKLAKGLIALGLNAGDCVAMINADSADTLLMFVATSTIGMVFTTSFIEGSKPYVKAKELLLHKEPKMILIGNAASFGTGNKPIHATEYLCAEFLSRLKQDPTYHVPHLFYDREAVLDDKCDQPEQFDLNELTIPPLETLRHMGRRVNDEQLNSLIDSVQYNMPCFCSSTSGSTSGKGKVVILGASQFVNIGRRKELRYNMNERTVFGVANPYSDDLALYEEFCSSVFTGRELVVLPPPGLDDHEICTEILECIEKTKCNMVYCDNYYFGYIMADETLRHSFNLEHCKSFLITGSGTSATFKRKVLNEFPNSVDCYGLTEIFYVATPVVGTQSEHIDSAGMPMPNDEVKVVNEAGDVVDRGTPGELWVRSYAICLGYKDNPEATKKSFTDNGWFKTGDCVTMDDTNQITIIGRLSKAEMCIVAGLNIFPRPIEKAMMTHKDIHDIAVVGVNTGTSVGDELCYCVIPEKGTVPSIEDIYNFADDVVDFLERPTRVFFFEKFPRVISRSKTDRIRLKEQCAEQIANDKYCCLCDREQYVNVYGSAD